MAVKVLKREDQRGGQEFLAEVEILRNLVKLIGICTKSNIRRLVYELVSNESLEFHLPGEYLLQLKSTSIFSIV